MTKTYLVLFLYIYASEALDHLRPEEMVSMVIEAQLSPEENNAY